jgi:hypothetical protein
VGKREVLSIGGADKDRTDRDPAPQGLILFDMTSLEWKDMYAANTAEYERANSLKDWYNSGYTSSLPNHTGSCITDTTKLVGKGRLVFG